MPGASSRPVRAIRYLIARHLPRHRQKARYLAVGGWNSLVAYGCFVVLYYLLEHSLPPSAIVAVAYLFASVNGYLTFRYLVFAPMRHPLVEYLRYQAVYLPLLALNLVALPLALQFTALNAYLIQAFLALFNALAAYLGNKYFAFRAPVRSR
jgi:putative flippase GtrA